MNRDAWKSRIVRLGSLFASLGIFSATVTAEVVRMEIRERGPFAGGHEFGGVGAYERVLGRLHCEVDPKDDANTGITDLQRAPTNSAGKVDYWTDFFLLKPVDVQRGSGRLLYDVNNRGNKLSLWTFNDGERGNNPNSLAHAGNGFLMRQGYSMLWCGWGGDVPEGDDRLLIGLPVAQEDGGPVTGRVHVEICRDDPVPSSPLYWTPWVNAVPYPPVSLDPSLGKLSMRPRRSEPETGIAARDWAFAREENGKKIEDAGSLWVQGGIRPGWLYDLTYTAVGPRVAGLGLAAVRDCNSFFRFEAADRAGTPNPLSGAIKRAYIFGISQSGRFVNHFIYGGFDTDEKKRMVFDGALAHVAGAGRGLFNHRFGMGTLAAIQHEHNLVPSDSFPFATVPQTDSETGKSGDVLRKARANGHVPKIFYTQTSTEYWTRAASLLHTDVAGTKDIGLDPRVRLYVAAGAHHLGAGTTDRGNYQNPGNPLDDRGPVLRALLVALDQWVDLNVEPPDSRYPKIGNGTLVTVEAFQKGFPRIPGVQLPTLNYAPLRLDFGPRWENEGIADIVPPKTGTPYRTLVPMVDADGNEFAGIRLPDIAVPLATHAGWNLRAPPHGADGMLAPYTGSYLAFSTNRAERISMEDPRPSVTERYPSREIYLTRHAEAARALNEQRLLLEEDVERIARVAEGRRFWTP